jgi:preprotein translocase subunit YajC
MNNLLSKLPMLQEDPTMNMIMMLGTVGAVILVFYFLIIRPQSKKQKALKNMLESLRKGDKVVTIGGMRGTVTSVKEQSVILKVDDNTKLEFNKNAVAQVLERKEGDDNKDESE